jgi:hypothetical protein
MTEIEKTSNGDHSPYVSLVNFCYQLRHENEELLETVALKSDLISACEKEINVLNARINELEAEKSTDSEKSLAERMDVSSDRYSLMQANIKTENQLREVETRARIAESQLESTREQVEILLTQLDESRKQTPETTAAVPTASALEEENKRLRNQLETAAFILAENQRKNKRRRLSEEEGRQTPSATTLVTVSSDDSLLRKFEELVGYNIVKADGIVTLVSQIAPKLTVRIRVGTDKKVHLLSTEGIDSDELNFFETSNSIPGLLARLTIKSLSTENENVA